MQKHTARNKWKLTINLIAFYIIGILSPFVYVSALGISPSVVEVPKAPQNAAIEKYFVVTRGNPSEPMMAKIAVEGQYASNITLLKGNEVELPKGQQQTRIPIVINTGSLPSGTYAASITVSAYPMSGTRESTTTGQGSAVIIAVKNTVRFTVTTDAIEDYSIESMFVQDTEEEMPIGFTFFLENRGTTDARPTKILLAFLDAKTKEEVYKKTIYGTEIELTKALLGQQYDILLYDTRLPSGGYIVQSTFYNKDKIIAEKSTVLQIVPQGTLSQKGSFESLSIDKTSYEKGETVKFTGIFKNIGDIPLKDVSLILEIFKNSDRIEVLKTVPVYVTRGGTITHELFYKSDSGGEYTVKGNFGFGPNKSNEQNITFNVKGLNWVIVYGIIGIIGIIALILFFLYSKIQPRSKSAPLSS